MVKLNNVTISYLKVLDYDGKYYGFTVDIVVMENYIEAWLRICTYGVSELMFGTDDFEYDDFIQIVEKNFDEYAIQYVEKYAKE